MHGGAINTLDRATGSSGNECPELEILYSLKDAQVVPDALEDHTAAISSQPNRFGIRTGPHVGDRISKRLAVASRTIGIRIRIVGVRERAVIITDKPPEASAVMPTEAVIPMETAFAAAMAHAKPTTADAARQSHDRHRSRRRQCDRPEAAAHAMTTATAKAATAATTASTASTAARHRDRCRAGREHCTQSERG